ncbi:MAG: topoisomerase DNA-binding C4 zinc finger domain-containing protein, partial [bacterium]|nr:topoisomerase DNA-binding C4 zinc finger domain-containing protein [bacterium]
AKIEVEETDEACPKCGEMLVVRVGKFGKFLACGGFPKCRFTKPLMQKTGIACPKCGQEVILRKTRSKKTFYGCSNYPKCDFSSWTKPDKSKTGA